MRTCAGRADTVVVLAKQPRPGRVKTRLQSRFSPDEAAQLAAAALRDTLDMVRSADVGRRLLAFDGDPAGWADGFEVAPQPGGTLGDRLDAAFAAVWSGPAERALLVGMDTPQVRAADLEVDWDGADALLGLAEDGGFWAIGLRRGAPSRIFDGVPMSTDRTGSAQLARLFDLGLQVRLLPPKRDVDLPDDAEAVATAYPELQFSRRWTELVGGRSEQSFDRLFDSVYAGAAEVTSGTTGGDATVLVLDVDRWSAEADRVDEMVVSRCEPPVIDLGCGPGRMVQALTRSGRSAMGVDVSQGAVEATRTRGGPALRRLVSETMPGEGRWGTALLMDGNLGIGGDVSALLRRCRDLVGPGGLVICEVDPDPARNEVGHVVLRSPGVASSPMPWSRIGAVALARIASALDLVLHEEWVAEGRAFVALRNSHQSQDRAAFPA